MVTYSEGETVSVSDPEWVALSPQVGMVIEIHMGSSSFLNPSDTWSSFFITEVIIENDYSFTLSVQFLGSEDEEVGAVLASAMGAGGTVHLCLGTPCVEPRPIEALHATRVRLWQWQTVERDCQYLVHGAKANVKKWLKELKSGKKPGMATQAKVKATKPKISKPTGEGGGNRSRKPPAKPGATSGLTEEMKAKLKSELGEVKKRVHGAADKAGDKQSPDAEVVDDSEEDGSEGYRPTSSEAGGAKLTTGAALVATRKELALAESPGHRKDGKVATKERSSKSLTNQLLLRAMDMNQKRKKGTKRKKEKKSKEGRVAELLTQILTKGSKDEKGKKRKKDKKKRKVIDGVIVSCSDSSESISGITSESDSETDLETPMKKKSRDKPGSVLSLLTEHVRDQVDQAALSDLPGRDHRVTSGIKILSYFSMHIKPQFPSYQRELREMNTIAATLDLLRSGDIARVGDSLSARFMAIHQSMIDQNWSTAKLWSCTTWTTTVRHQLPWYWPQESIRNWSSGCKEKAGNTGATETLGPREKEKGTGRVPMAISRAKKEKGRKGRTKTNNGTDNGKRKSMLGRKRKTRETRSEWIEMEFSGCIRES